MNFNPISQAIAFTVFAAFVSQSPVMALGTRKTSVESSSDSSSYLWRSGNRILIVKDDYYTSKDGDFQILMPGDINENEITQNEGGKLTSISLKTRTAYSVYHRDLPNTVNADFLSTQDKYRILNESFRSSSQKLGNRILKFRNISIKGHLGIDALVLNSDGSVSSSRLYFVRNRIYALDTTSLEELGQEVEDFFDSFEVYPSKITPR